MALDLSMGRETSEGPLDAVNSDGADEGPPIFGRHGSDSEPLEPLSASDDEAEVLHHKNPLGYTITQPTEDEIEDLNDVGAAATKSV